MHCPGYTPVGLSPDDLQGEHNRPPDSENGEHGGELPFVPVGPASGQAPWLPMQPQQPPMQPPQQQHHHRTYTMVTHLYHQVHPQISLGVLVN
jgi:hypothetical protein